MGLCNQSSSSIQPYYTSFSDFGVGWGSRGQSKAKHVNLIFLHTFQLIRMKFKLVLKQFMLNFLVLLLCEI